MSLLFDKLAIVVLSFNHPELTARAVNSALKLHEKVYLVHNGSEKRFVTKLKSQFENVIHLEIEKNCGYSGGVNFGLQTAFHIFDWVILITNDCVLKSLPTLSTEPAFIAPHILIKKTNRTDSIGGSFIPYLGKISHCKTLNDFLNSKNKYIPGSAFLLHKNVFEITGPFEESLGTYWEDVDFSQRALRKNQILAADPNWTLEHARGKTCHKDRHYTLYLFQRNRKRVSMRYTDFIYKPILFINLWTAWITLACRLIFRSRTQDLRLLLRAIQD